MAGGAILDDAEDGAAVLRGEIRRILGYALSGAATNAIHDSSVFLIVSTLNPQEDRHQKSFCEPLLARPAGRARKDCEFVFAFRSVKLKRFSPRIVVPLHAPRSMHCARSIVRKLCRWVFQ